MVYYTNVQTTAQLLGISVQTIYSWSRRGKMFFHVDSRVGYLIPLSDIAMKLGISERDLLKQMYRKGQPVWGCE